LKTKQEAVDFKAAVVDGAEKYKALIQ